MRDAQALLMRGDFAGSAQQYRNVLTLSPKKPPADAALFKLGLIYADPENPNCDENQARRSFGALMAGYPESVWVLDAKVWLALLDEKSRSKTESKLSKEQLEQSQQEVERLKELVEKFRQEIEKSRLELEKSKLDMEKSRQAMERATQVDIEIEQKKRERGR